MSKWYRLIQVKLIHQIVPSMYDVQKCKKWTCLCQSALVIYRADTGLWNGFTCVASSTQHLVNAVHSGGQCKIFLRLNLVEHH